MSGTWQPGQPWQIGDQPGTPAPPSTSPPFIESMPPAEGNSASSGTMPQTDSKYKSTVDPSANPTGGDPPDHAQVPQGPDYSNWNWEQILNGVLGLGIPDRNEVISGRWTLIENNKSTDFPLPLIWEATWDPHKDILAFLSPWVLQPGQPWDAFFNGSVQAITTMDTGDFRAVAADPRTFNTATAALAGVETWAGGAMMTFGGITSNLAGEAGQFKGQAGAAFQNLMGNLQTAASNLWTQMSTPNSYSAMVSQSGADLWTFMLQLLYALGSWAFAPDAPPTWSPLGALEFVLQSISTRNSDGSYSINNWKLTYYGDLSQDASWVKLENDAKNIWIQTVQDVLDATANNALQALVLSYETTARDLVPINSATLPPISPNAGNAGLGPNANLNGLFNSLNNLLPSNGLFPNGFPDLSNSNGGANSLVSPNGVSLLTSPNGANLVSKAVVSPNGGPLLTSPNGANLVSPAVVSPNGGPLLTSPNGANLVSPAVVSPNGGSPLTGPGGSNLVNTAINPNAGSLAANPNGESLLDEAASNPNGNSVLDQALRNPNGNSVLDQALRNPNANTLLNQALNSPPNNSPLDRALQSPPANTALSKALTSGPSKSALSRALTGPPNNSPLAQSLTGTTTATSIIPATTGGSLTAGGSALTLPGGNVGAQAPSLIGSQALVNRVGQGALISSGTQAVAGGTQAQPQVSSGAFASGTAGGTTTEATSSGEGEFPFYSPMGMGGMGMGGMGMGGMGTQERERSTWLAEDEEIWGTSPEVGVGVLRPDALDEPGDEDYPERPEPTGRGRDRRSRQGGVF
jgi:hypothetical protein